jgi:hypothetical protein
MTKVKQSENHSATLILITVVKNDYVRLLKTAQAIAKNDTSIMWWIQNGGSKLSNQQILKIRKMCINHQIYFGEEPDRGLYDGMNIAIRKIYQTHSTDSKNTWLWFVNCGDLVTISDGAKNLLHKLKDINQDLVITLDSQQDEIFKINPTEINSKDFHRKFLIGEKRINHQTTFFRLSRLILFDSYDTKYKVVADFALIESYIFEDNFTFVNTVTISTEFAKFSYDNRAKAEREKILFLCRKILGTGSKVYLYAFTFRIKGYYKWNMAKIFQKVLNKNE